MSGSNRPGHMDEDEREDEETHDPFLSLDAHLRPQTLYQHEHHHRQPHHGHEHGHVDEEDIDPSLHADHTHRDQDTSRTRVSTNRLTDFASHILGSQDGDRDGDGHGNPHDRHHDRQHEDHDHERNHDHEHMHDHDQHQHHEHEHEHDHDTRGHLSFTGQGGVLESSNHDFGGGFHAVGESLEIDAEAEQAMEDEGEFEPHIEDDHDHHEDEDGRDFEREETVVGEGLQTPGQAQAGQGQGGGRVGKKRGPYITSGRGRKRTGDPIDATIVKKSNHKEVERKRRNNISEGIDQLVAQMGIPDLEKAGKAVQLKRAVEYMAEMGERLGGVDKELEDLRREKQDLEANLALTSQRYTEEHERCTRYETLWRDAQDREAKGQFEIAQLLDEISQLRAKR